ncbi:MAG: nitrous oxide reductase family maturation protein NosD [bacterium]
MTRAFDVLRAARGVLLLLVAVASASGAQQTIVVSPAGPVRTLTAAIQLARRGALITVTTGVYREPTIVVDKSLTITGEGLAVLDGQGQRQIMTVRADSVTIRNLTFRDVGSSFREDRAAIAVSEASDCVIEHNHIERAFFGIYLARVSRCRIAHNTLAATPGTETASGNGIHLWTADHITIADNHISGHRDGIYFEFVHNSDVEGNVSEGNSRYGLHFMFSDGCRYLDNTFRHNGSGVAVMYTRHVEMTRNRFEENVGGAAYGLLLKEISDARLEDNQFSRNTTGLFVDGTTRLVVRHNAFRDNGWAIRLDANAQDGRIVENDFQRNTFDIATNGRNADTVLEGNFWDSYAGYDLRHDGVGDVPHRPVRLFSMIVQQNAPALILLRSTFVALLDAAERVIPALTPESLADHRPSMRPLRAVLR